MNKLKIYVYAITKNESKFVSRWVESMSEADKIYVLDTGSDDDTVKKLEELGVNVKCEKIDPWRFDVARNKSLEMVPSDADICVCTDLDEVFDPGWREKLENIWLNNNITRLKYNYIWSFNEYGNPATTFYISKIHKREGYIWKHPVHEVLENTIEEIEYTTDDITLKHYPDKNKSRSSYLPLLELSVREDPEDDRNMHYLGREYMYYGKWNEAIDTLIRHLNLKSARWDAERCASMRFIARCYLHLTRNREAEMWYKLAKEEASYLRESYVELASLYNDLGKYKEAKQLLEEAFLIKNKANIYINEDFAWNDYIYELYSLVLYNLKLYPESLFYMKKARDINPKEERIINNVKKLEEILNVNNGTIA